MSLNAKNPLRFSRELIANGDIECDMCADIILDEDPFYYVQSGPHKDERVCDSCREELTNGPSE